jgi:D-serine deaminase-like pyridoxal phosphate-dependent protein
MTRLDDCSTPSLVLDRDRLVRNAGAMVDRCHARGVRLRPHMKTLKSADAARLAVDPTHGGIAVATLKEAEYFAAHGFSDIQLAVCLSPDKLARAAAISTGAPLFSFFLDSVNVARAVAERARRDGGTFRVWLEVDCGEHRTGFDPDGPDLLAAAQELRATLGVTLVGIASHAGHAYGARTATEIAAIAEEERRVVVAAAERVRAAGLGPLATSVGSTPTAVHGGPASGISEVRAGVYMAGDLFQVDIGSQPRDSLAVTVLASVISHNRTRNQIVVDAGGLALSKDRSTAGRGEGDFGYGLVLDIAGADRFGDLCVVDVHQEHGEIRSDQPLPFDALPIGAKVRIAPNHVCMTAAMYDDYLVVEGGAEVVERWRRTNGW